MGNQCVIDTSNYSVWEASLWDFNIVHCKQQLNNQSDTLREAWCLATAAYAVCPGRLRLLLRLNVHPHCVLMLYNPVTAAFLFVIPRDQQLCPMLPRIRQAFRTH